MALIYAFRDEAGHWHGDPAGHPPDGESILTFRPGPGDPGWRSPFAGQALVVRMAGIVAATPGLVRYFLDDETSCYATRAVERELFGPEVAAARRLARWPPAPPAARPEEPGERRYDLTLAPEPDGLAVEITGADRDGRVIAHVQGHLPGADLALVGRLLLDAVAPRHGRWTPAEVALAVRRHGEGAEVDEIAAELRRTGRSVRFKLHYLGLVPLPAAEARRSGAAHRRGRGRARVVPG
ncbi:hypothetical protein [Actinoplanes sp. L3-i22]|uniref:hypothetical protein n=1 Tax=Actinoplanes sp. L3-i22 TaxID=2836373 RepID=UPI001C74B5B5|nr:hypothetical protein [Actinoplanes sp. L3-i22]BCY10529.1 hypothetical protein L3i22_056170 [Actinoplanes sp. L3-i22]